ncbi:MFS transporter, partial [Mesorhizobium sp. M2A.F.Ca.ET.040.01.1.1]
MGQAHDPELSTNGTNFNAAPLSADRHRLFFRPRPVTGLSAGFSYFLPARLTLCPVMSNCSITFELRTNPMDKRIFWLALGSFAISTEGFVISSLLPD